TRLPSSARRRIAPRVTRSLLRVDWLTRTPSDPSSWLSSCWEVKRACSSNPRSSESRAERETSAMGPGEELGQRVHEARELNGRDHQRGCDSEHLGPRRV